MTSYNRFTDKYKNESLIELLKIIDNHQSYQTEAVDAAKAELKNRGLNIEQARLKVKEENERILNFSGELKRNIGIPVKTVTPGLRFVHFLIDGFIVQLVTYVLEFIPWIELSQLFVFLLFPVYYIFFEFQYQWTPGKLVSGTIVINNQGEKPSLKQVILRTFARLVPFEPFSCLDTSSWGWHDRWTRTYVIFKTDLNVLRKKLNLSPIQYRVEKYSQASYILIGVAVVCIVGGAMFTRQITGLSSGEAIQMIKELDRQDYNNIQGFWVTNSLKLGNLNFISKDSVLSVQPNKGVSRLTFKIENRLLTLSDDSGTEWSLMIGESSKNEFLLIDTNKPFKQMKWIRD